jgi:hypothetical protein
MASDWRADLLKLGRFPITRDNLAFLSAWQRQEGGHTHNRASFNWLNTSKGQQFPAINKVGVRAFPDYQTGLRYTLSTILNGRYPNIVAGLRSGNPQSQNLLPDLSTWVSGDSNSSSGKRYAERVTGQKLYPDRGSAAAVAQAIANPAGQSEDMRRSLFLSHLMANNRAFAAGQPTVPLASFLLEASKNIGEDQGVTAAAPQKPSGGRLGLPMQWTGTHVTDNLDWNRGRKTAIDIMGAPGTTVTAPVAGVILRHGSAQGGQSLYFKGRNNKTYWLGHIENIHKPGTFVPANTPLARISGDHPRPHVHWDVDL